MKIILTVLVFMFSISSHAQKNNKDQVAQKNIEIRRVDFRKKCDDVIRSALLDSYERRSCSIMSKLKDDPNIEKVEFIAAETYLEAANSKRVNESCADCVRKAQKQSQSKHSSLQRVYHLKITYYDCGKDLQGKQVTGCTRTMKASTNTVTVGKPSDYTTVDDGEIYFKRVM